MIVLCSPFVFVDVYLLVCCRMSRVQNPKNDLCHFVAHLNNINYMLIINPYYQQLYRKPGADPVPISTPPPSSPECPKKQRASIFRFHLKSSDTVEEDDCASCSVYKFYKSPSNPPPFIFEILDPPLTFVNKHHAFKLA